MQRITSFTLALPLLIATPSANAACATPGAAGDRNDDDARIEDYEGRGVDEDMAIRASVGTRLLAEPEVRRMNIDIDVVDGVVYLSGVVHDPEARDAAERIAMNVEGVVRVENQLTVSPVDDRLSTDANPGAGEQRGPQGQ